MKLFKKLHCDNLHAINKEIMNFVSTQLLEQNKFWNPVDVVEFAKSNPQFVQWCKQNNLLVKNVAITYGVSANCCIAHTDTPPSIYKLSWPVQNTQHTWNRWFSYQPDADTETNSLGGTTYLNYAQLKELDRMQVDQPALIAVGIPHDVWFEPDAVYPRIGLQCQLFNEPAEL